jgi:transcriptional regulator with XRE-family HTH domain
MKTFKERLIKAMFDQKATQKKVAQALKVVQGTVSSWKLGGSHPRPAQFIKLAEFLKVSPQWLEYGTHIYADQQNPPINLSEPEATYRNKISDQDLIEFYKWKSEKANQELERLQETIKNLDVESK